MEFKGTKGKWFLEQSGCQNKHTYHIKSLLDRCESCGTKNIVEIGDLITGAKRIDNLSNAQLISKSPEMLEMLKDILSGMKGDNFEVSQHQIEQLIKEATNV